MHTTDVDRSLTRRRRTRVAANLALVVMFVGCSSDQPGATSGTDSQVPTFPPATVATSTNPPPTEVSTTAAPSTTTASPSSTPVTTVVPLDDECTEMGADRTPATGVYDEAAFDRFGPLDRAAGLTIEFGHGSTSDSRGLRADRIEGGVLVSVSRSPDRPPDALDRLPITAVDHDGTIRWNHCVDGNQAVQTAVAAPGLQPANALIIVRSAQVPGPQLRFVQLSLTNGAEQPNFAAAMRSIGVEDLSRLMIADTTDRYALLTDNSDVFGGAAAHLLRYDLVDDAAVDVGVPAEMASNGDAGPCRGAPQPTLTESGDVLIIEQTTDVVSGAADVTDTGAVLARWHDGAWNNDPTILTDAVGVRPGFACSDDPAERVLRGVDANGAVRWTDAALTHPGADDVGWHLDADMAVGQVCSQRIAEACQRIELVGIDPATGRVRWTQPGFRLVAGDPADGSVLVWAEPIGDILEPPGWVLLDDRTGHPVAEQEWDDPQLFTLYPSREVAGFNRTVRAGGLIVVVQDLQVRIWYPKGTGGAPRLVSMP